MKYIFIILLSGLLVGQIDTLENECSKLPDPSKYKLNIGTIEPSHLIVINSPSGRKLNFDFAGDSLKCWGDLKPDSAASLFIKYVIENYSDRINSLKKEIEKLRRKK